MAIVIKQTTEDPNDPTQCVVIGTDGAAWFVGYLDRATGVYVTREDFGDEAAAKAKYIAHARGMRLDHDQAQLAIAYKSEAPDIGVVTFKEREAENDVGAHPDGCYICNGDHATVDCQKYQ